MRTQTKIRIRQQAEQSETTCQAITASIARMPLPPHTRLCSLQPLLPPARPPSLPDQKQIKCRPNEHKAPTSVPEPSKTREMVTSRLPSDWCTSQSARPTSRLCRTTACEGSDPSFAETRRDRQQKLRTVNVFLEKRDTQSDRGLTAACCSTLTAGRL